jgi:electron transfer flavoprotein alpha/beta subunit
LALALMLRDATPGARVLAIAVGPKDWEEPLRHALAAGADAVLRLWNAAWPQGRWRGELDGSATHTQFVARAVAETLRGRGAALALSGESSLDGGHGSFGAFLAHALGASYAHRAVALGRDGDASPTAPAWRARVKLERGYTQDLALASPAVVSVSAGLPPPPEAGLPAWMASRAAAIPAITAALPYPAAPPTQLRAPVPRVKRYVVPEPALNAEARIRAMVDQPLSGGGALLQAPEGADAQTEAALKLLEARGFVKGR